MGRIRTITRRDALGMLAGAGLCATAGAPARADLPAATGPGLFGSVETRRTGGHFPKWQGALERSLAEIDNAKCLNGTRSACPLRQWRRLLDELAGAPVDEQIDVVNREMNRRRYITDPVNWGVPDYWASVGEFHRKNGDCEDYAISKYFSLRSLGHPADAMRIVVLHDRNLDLPHAILAIARRGDSLILDNQIDRVVSHTVIRHYQPIFSINESAWWLHQSPPNRHANHQKLKRFSRL